MFYYDPSPDITIGSFTAARAFFLANGHEVETIKCPDVSAFAAGFPGAIVRRLSDLLVLIFAEGVASSSTKTKPSPASLQRWAVLCMGVAPRLLHPDRFSILNSLTA